jgi:hypothetical protein
LICSDEFAPLARAESIVNGIPGLPLVVIPHPIAGNFADLVRRKAEAVVDEVLQVLTDSEQALVERYQGRFTKPAERRLSPESVCTDAVCAVDLTRPE